MKATLHPFPSFGGLRDICPKALIPGVAKFSCPSVQR